MAEEFKWDTQLRAAFSGYLKWIGIALCALSLFSWLSRTLSLGLVSFIAVIRSSYEALFHPFIDFLTWWLPISLTAAQKDLIFMYLLTGSAVSRTLYIYVAGFRKADVMSVSAGRIEFWARSLSQSSLKLGVGAILAILGWPILSLFFIAEPVLMQNSDFAMLWNWRNIRLSRKSDPDLDYDGWSLIDLRLVLILQLSAALGIVVLILLLNAASLR